MLSVKTSLSEPMQFQITQIDFDFVDDEGPLPIDIQNEIIDDVIGMIWDATDEEDLVEEITAATGWCIKSIDYNHILN